MNQQNEVVSDILTISGQNIPIQISYLDHSELKFYPENPRIYSIVCSECSNEPDQLEIEKKLVQMDHVKRLIQSIKANGGLTDPIIVTGKDNVVVEGNSRLAAYRQLCKTDPISWSKIRCKILPNDIDDSLIFALLGEYHIIGRKDWDPYEQAGYLYRRKTVHGAGIDQIAREIGLSKNEIQKLIHTYEFMLQHGDNDRAHWSYYDEYLGSRDINAARENHPELDSVVVAKIKEGEINKAIEVRHKLKVITKKPKQLKKFISGKSNFETCFDLASSDGCGKAYVEKLKKFKEFIADSELEKEIMDSGEAIIHTCKYELGKIKSRVESILKKIS